MPPRQAVVCVEVDSDLLDITAVQQMFPYQEVMKKLQLFHFSPVLLLFDSYVHVHYWHFSGPWASALDAKRSVQNFLKGQRQGSLMAVYLDGSLRRSRYYEYLS